LKLSKSFFARLFWFVVGGVLSIGVNAGLFRLFCSGFGWNRYVGYALSLAIVNVLLFLWNYVVGFKTDRHWTDAAWRQIVCLAAANGLNYALVMVLQGMFPQWPALVISLLASKTPTLLKALPRWPEVIIAAVQVFIALFKFALYHYWVYVEPEPALATAGADQAS
jgi:putative flippase GtrA